MEHKAEEIITYNYKGKTIYLKVTPTKYDNCIGCFFYRNSKFPFCSSIEHIIGECNKYYRSDKTPVIFKQINNNKL